LLARTTPYHHVTEVLTGGVSRYLEHKTASFRPSINSCARAGAIVGRKWRLASHMSGNSDTTAPPAWMAVLWKAMLSSVAQAMWGAKGPLVRPALEPRASGFQF
jgi:hypothetical protein